MQGHLDSPLTEEGLSQARSVGERLSRIGVTAIYSSDLGRAWKTAEEISRRTGVSVRADVRLRERNLGIFQGHTEQEIIAQYPNEWERFLTRDPDYRMPGGESSRDRVIRSVAALDEIGVRHEGALAVLVTHGGILDGIFRAVTGLALDLSRHFKIWNGAVNIISRSARSNDEADDTGGLQSGGPAGSGAGWMIDLWGEGSHLPV